MARGAFGSGEHETTASCLEILETLPEVRGARVLDLGSGTGILAIAAIRLGASRAVCIDVDPAAAHSARRNCRLNRVGDRVEHVVGRLEDSPSAGFDLAIANLYGDLLLGLGREICARVRPEDWSCSRASCGARTTMCAPPSPPRARACSRAAGRGVLTLLLRRT